jgi:hypothetical protein
LCCCGKKHPTIIIIKSTVLFNVHVFVCLFVSWPVSDGFRHRVTLWHKKAKERVIFPHFHYMLQRNFIKHTYIHTHSHVLLMSFWVAGDTSNQYTHIHTHICYVKFIFTYLSFFYHVYAMTVLMALHRYQVFFCTSNTSLRNVVLVTTSINV